MYKFSNHFHEFVNQSNFSKETSAFQKLVNSILNDDFHAEDLATILNDNHIKKIEDLKSQSLEFLLNFSNFVLKDSTITESESNDFHFLKRIFKIKEGDFMKFKQAEIKEILKKQFIRIYSDNYVNTNEEIENFQLQSLFDLSYNEYENMQKDEIINALINGANSLDLDIAKIPKDFNY